MNEADRVNEAAENSPTEVTLRIEHHVGIEAKFSNHMLIQVDPDTYHLLFFHIPPPILLGDTPEEIREKLNRSDGKVVAECVGRVIVPRARMREYLSVMANHVDKHDPKPMTEPPTQNS